MGRAPQCRKRTLCLGFCDTECLLSSLAPLCSPPQRWNHPDKSFPCLKAPPRLPPTHSLLCKSKSHATWSKTADCTLCSRYPVTRAFSPSREGGIHFPSRAPCSDSSLETPSPAVYPSLSGTFPNTSSMTPHPWKPRTYSLPVTHATPLLGVFTTSPSDWYFCVVLFSSPRECEGSQSPGLLCLLHGSDPAPGVVPGAQWETWMSRSVGE